VVRAGARSGVAGDPTFYGQLCLLSQSGIGWRGYSVGHDVRTWARLPAVLVLVAAVQMAAPAARAGAPSGWTTPQSFATGKPPEIVPRAGIAADGSAAVAWKNGRGALVVSVRGRRGAFGPSRVVDRAGARDWSVAAAPGGAFVVAWKDRDAIRLAVRTRSGRAVVVRRVTASTGDAVQAAHDPRGGGVIAEERLPRPRVATQVRVLSLDGAGRRSGPVQALGTGRFGENARQPQSLAVDPAGRAVFAFERAIPDRFDERSVLVTTRPHGGAFGEPVAIGDLAAEPRVAVGAGGRAVVAAAPGECAERYCFGAPRVVPLSAAGAPGSAFGPSLSAPGRAFAPLVALTGPDRGVLVFQHKMRGSSQFTPEGSVRAVAFTVDGDVSGLQTLTPAQAVEPAVQPLSGGRALVLWAGARRVGAALAGPDGRFRRTAAPAGGRPDPGHGSQTNRDLRAAGRHAIFAWQHGDSVRISVRRF
jgi:hypothetical protein